LLKDTFQKACFFLQKLFELLQFSLRKKNWNLFPGPHFT